MPTHVSYWTLRNKYSPPLHRWRTAFAGAEVFTAGAEGVRPAAPSANGEPIDPRGGLRGGDGGPPGRS